MVLLLFTRGPTSGGQTSKLFLAGPYGNIPGFPGNFRLSVAGHYISGFLCDIGLTLYPARALPAVRIGISGYFDLQ